jgi:perosamine synthetase
MFNLNFASNENCREAKKAFSLLWRRKSWQKGEANTNLKSILASKFLVEKDQIFFTLAARSSLHLFLKSLSLTQESEVLVQAFTCEAVVLPILAADLFPVYVDIEEESWSMSLEDLKKKITDKSRVLILQHSFAMLPRDREKILKFAKHHHLIVIEDLAHGFSPKLLNDQSNKTCKLLSFGRSKFFSVVYGGAIIVESSLLNNNFVKTIDQLDLVENCFIKKALFYKVLAPLIKITYKWGGKFFHALFNYFGIFGQEISKKERGGKYDPYLEKTLPNVFAKLLLDQVETYAKIYQNRQTISSLYWEKFPQKIVEDNLPSLRYPLLVNQADKFLEQVAKRGFILGNWYRQVVAPPELDLAKVKYQNESCSNAEQMSRQVINLPLNISLKKAKKLLKIIDDVKKNFN